MSDENKPPGGGGGVGGGLLAWITKLKVSLARKRQGAAVDGCLNYTSTKFLELDLRRLLHLT
jgi:hypothetical protein